MLTMRGHPPNERLRKLRKEILQMSLVEMVEALECCSRSSLSAYEKGTRNPGRAAALRIQRLAEKAKYPIAADDWP